MATAPSHPLQGVPIAETAMSAFFMAFVACVCLAVGAFAAGLSVQTIVGGIEIQATTMAAAMSAAVSLFFAVLAVLLVTVFA